MKRITILFMLILCPLFVSKAQATAIVQTTDYITFPVVALDSATGVPAVPESVHVYVWYGSVSDAATYSNNEVCDGADCAQIDSVDNGWVLGIPQYYFHDQVQDIDGAGTAGTYTVNVRMWRGYTPTDNRFTFQIVDSSFTNALTRIGQINEDTKNLPTDPADDSDIDGQLATIDNFVDTEVAEILDTLKTYDATIHVVIQEILDTLKTYDGTLHTKVQSIVNKSDSLNFQGQARGTGLAVSVERIAGDSVTAANLEKAYDGDTTWGTNPRMTLEHLFVRSETATDEGAIYANAMGSTAGHGIYGIGKGSGVGIAGMGGATGCGAGFYAAGEGVSPGTPAAIVLWDGTSGHISGWVDSVSYVNNVTEQVNAVQAYMGAGDGWRQHLFPFAAANKDSIRTFDAGTCNSTIYLWKDATDPTVLDSITQEIW